MEITSENRAQEFAPSETWIDAFTDQCTDEMRIRAKQYATRRLRGIGKAGGHVDDYAARELVQDVLGDTLFGVVVWSPEAKSLQQHVEDVIHSRTFHQRVRTKRYPHQRIDAFDPASEHTVARGEVEVSLTSRAAAPGFESQMFASEVVGQVRTLAANDAQILRFLEAVLGGARGRTDVMHAASLTAKEFRNTRARLRRLVDKLNNQTVATLRQA